MACLCVSDAPDNAVEADEALQKVCEAVMRIRSRELTLRKAAEIYGIPRSTLSDRVCGRVRLFARRVQRRRPRPIRQSGKCNQRFQDNSVSFQMSNDHPACLFITEDNLAEDSVPEIK